MDKIIFELKNQIYETAILCKNFFKGVNLWTLGFTLTLFFIFFFRRWEFKKTFSFFFTIFALFILLVRLEAFFISTLEAETSNFALSLTRTVAAIVAGAVFFYYAAVKE